MGVRGALALSKGLWERVRVRDPRTLLGHLDVTAAADCATLLCRILQTDCFIDGGRAIQRSTTDRSRHTMMTKKAML